VAIGHAMSQMRKKCSLELNAYQRINLSSSIHHLIDHFLLLGGYTSGPIII
jgi:hypothetical protein